MRNLTRKLRVVYKNVLTHQQPQRFSDFPLKHDGAPPPSSQNGVRPLVHAAVTLSQVQTQAQTGHSCVLVPGEERREGGG